MTPFRFIRYIIEALGMLLGFLVIPLLPRRAVVELASLIGALAFRIAERDRRVAQANLKVVLGPGSSEEQVDAAARGSFENFALVLLDLFWFSLSSRSRTARHVRFDQEYERSFAAGPFIYLTAHHGNWEVLGLATALKTGDLMSVAAPLDNPFANRLLVGMRKGTGQVIVNKYGAVRDLLRKLKNGGKAALVMDQNTLPGEGGCFVDLFGLPAPVSMAPASLVRHADCDAALVCCVPDGKGCYDARLVERFGCDEVKSLTPEELTRRLAAAMERMVRKDPDKWLSSYKRWKFVPHGADRSKFPFYSRSI